MTTETAAAPAPAPGAAAPAIPPLDEDSFDAVFAKLAEEDHKPADTKTEPVDPPEPLPGAAADAGAEGAETPPVPAVPPPAAAAPAVPPPAAAAPAVPPAVDPELATARARIAELEAAAKAPKPADAPAAAVAEPPKEEGPKWYQPTDEEKKLIEDHVKEWPEISAAEAVRVKIATYNAVQYVFDTITKQYGPLLTRFGDLSDAIENHLALQAVTSKHPDYEQLYDEMLKWVDTLPGYVKVGAKKVVEEGNPEEVAQLVADYKAAKAASSPAGGAATPPAAPAAPAGGTKPELSDAAKKAAGKLAVVNTKRTATTSQPDQQDFDRAWDEAAAAGQ